jgi:hypothetical protein
MKEGALSHVLSEQPSFVGFTVQFDLNSIHFSYVLYFLEAFPQLYAIQRFFSSFQIHYNNPLPQVTESSKSEQLV